MVSIFPGNRSTAGRPPVKKDRGRSCLEDEQGVGDDGLRSGDDHGIQVDLGDFGMEEGNCADRLKDSGEGGHVLRGKAPESSGSLFFRLYKRVGSRLNSIRIRNGQR